MQINFGSEIEISNIHCSLQKICKFYLTFRELLSRYFRKPKTHLSLYVSVIKYATSCICAAKSFGRSPGLLSVAPNGRSTLFNRRRYTYSCYKYIIPIRQYHMIMKAY